MNLFAFHDPGGEQMIRDAQRTGWIIFTEALGCDPADHTGKDFAQWAHGGIEAIVRLNNGYYPGGTIPHSSQYANFAQRCANFVEASTGSTRWIIGNETNLPIERPGGETGEVITPALYAEAFTLCRQAIKAVQPEACVIPAAVGPWNNQTAYAGNESGDWVQYFADVLGLLGDQLDAIAIHTYTHGPDPALVRSEQKMDAPFSSYHYHFRAYRDFLAALPPALQGLPIYISETDENEAWLDQNSGWVQAAYAEIDDWNRDNVAQIHCLALYRWPNYDLYYIEGKNGVYADLRAAMLNDYQAR